MTQSTPLPTPSGSDADSPGDGDRAARWAHDLEQAAAGTDPTVDADRAIARRIALLPRSGVPAGVWVALELDRKRRRAHERAITLRWALAAALAGVVCGLSMQQLLDTAPRGGWPTLAGRVAPAPSAGSDARLSEDLAIAYGLDRD